MRIKIDSKNFVPRLQIKMFGEWEKAEKLTNYIGIYMDQAYLQASEEYAQKVANIVREAVRTGIPPPNGGVNWQELKQSTISRWGQHNIYNLRGELLRSIIVQGSKRIRYVTIANGNHTYGSKRSINEIMRILEYGSDYGIPRRPLWAPALVSAGSAEELSRITMTKIRSILLRNFGIRANMIK